MDSKDSLVIRHLGKDVSTKIISLNKNKLKTNFFRININYQVYNENELNNMDYNYALKYDKRTYTQYYWSLIKKKHLIIFTFLSNNDYNIISIKINLFLVIFTSYFTINGFFFNDETMHKIYINNVNFSILYQIPQIILSSVISIILNYTLKILALSENDILELKKERDFKKMTKKSKVSLKYIKIKFIIFFIISIMLLGFFWYFIACFCGIFINTQILLIKDTFSSFLLTLIYPFGWNLIPAIFRIIALRDKQKKRKCVYQISKLMGLI